MLFSEGQSLTSQLSCSSSLGEEKISSWRDKIGSVVFLLYKPKNK